MSKPDDTEAWERDTTGMVAPECPDVGSILAKIRREIAG